MGLKTIGNTIKNPIFKTFGNTMKNSMGILCRSKNTIKTFASNLEKKYLISHNNFASRSIKYLSEQGIRKFKYTLPYTFKKSKKNI